MSFDEKIDVLMKGAQRNLLKYQHNEGCFFGDTIFNIYASASYLIFLDYLGLTHPKKKDIINWILLHQNNDGSWGNILENGNGNYQFTLIAQTALEGYCSEEVLAKAETWLRTYRGKRWIDPYTRLAISMKKPKKIGLISPPWWILFIPDKIAYLLGKLHMKFPKLFRWSIFFYPSAWTKNAAYGLIIAHLNKNQKHFINKIILKCIGKKVIRDQLKNGSWYDLGGITTGTIFGLILLGNSKEKSMIKRALKFLENMVSVCGNVCTLRLSVWDTALSLIALSESNYPKDTKEIQSAIKFLIRSQSDLGGWSFTEYMKNLPDNDDTALVLMALSKFLGSNVPERIKKKAYDFLIKMQNDDGGWGAFLKNQCYKYPGRIPPFHKECRHELKDPSTADVTGHVLQTLGEVHRLNIKTKCIENAKKFLKGDQLGCGAWWGRWGICYIYGTTQVISGLKAVNEDMDSDYIKKAIKWLIKIQNKDGGWGEDFRSIFSEKPILGKSTVEHTSWSIIALLDANIEPDSSIIKKGVRYIINNQQNDGTFPSSYVASAIDPGKYEIYSAIFPLYALSKWQRKIKEKKNGCNENN